MPASRGGAVVPPGGVVGDVGEPGCDGAGCDGEPGEGAPGAGAGCDGPGWDGEPGAGAPGAGTGCDGPGCDGEPGDGAPGVGAGCDGPGCDGDPGRDGDGCDGEPGDGAPGDGAGCDGEPGPGAAPGGADGLPGCVCDVDCAASSTGTAPRDVWICESGPEVESAAGIPLAPASSVPWTLPFMTPLEAPRGAEAGWPLGSTISGRGVVGASPGELP
ncbi:MAG TPA: hypothetical protein VGD37_18870 [Kofleriaceae bacterium]